MVRFDRGFIKLAAVCAAGIALNVSGTFIVSLLGLPIYLDTIGTVFISVLGGYVPGIAVGFFTNLGGAIFSPNELYFGVVNIAVAIITAFLASKGYYEKFPKVLAVIPATVLMTSFMGVFIEELLSSSNRFGSLDSFLLIGSHILRNFSYELPDKGAAVLLSFFALKFIPKSFKANFDRLGKMQAPVSPEMHRAIKARNDFILSLRTKMIFNLMSITILVAFFISAISYMIYQENSIKERERIADGIVTMIANEINPNRVDEFIRLGHQAQGYNDVERNLYKIRASNSDIKYLYVYKIMEDGCHVVFDLQTAEFDAAEPGAVEEFDESFKPYLPDLFAGRPIPPIINDDKYGYLLTVYKPVYNSVGQCTCYAAIDFSMDLINEYGRMFISKVIAMFSGVVIFIFTLGLWFIENNIILPVNTMAWCARNFAYDSEEAREQNIAYMQSLNIKTHDEIENLYSAFLKTTSDSMHYFDNLRKAKIQVAVMDELAHKDSLTGIKNKTAYSEITALLEGDILAGTANFAIVMIDVNYLKKVNDTYGHERGDEYLINACNLVCEIFGADNVYRIGGDEFVAVLRGDEVAHCEEFVARIRSAVEKFRADSTLEPWEKVSAAVGVAYYEAGVDNEPEDVFKRADEQMYANKLAMKAVRKD